MKRKNVGALIAGGALMALVGCGSEEVGQHLSEPGLMKTWEGECASSDLLDLSMKTYFEFGGDDYKEVHTFFAEDDCRTPAAEIVYQGAVKLREEAPEGTRDVDFRFDSVAVKALGAEGQRALEAVDLCGTDTWPVNRVVDLSGRTGTATCPLRKVPTGEFNVFALENDTLYLGKSGLKGGATVESDRPEEVDRDKPFRPSRRDL